MLSLARFGHQLFGCPVFDQMRPILSFSRQQHLSVGEVAGQKSFLDE
jgi:hypothetical protein